MSYITYTFEYKPFPEEWGADTRTHTISTSTDGDYCEHMNGTFRTIPARWFGRRDVFVCADCHKILDHKTLDVV